MNARIIFRGYLLCAALLFAGCINDPIQVALPTVKITGTNELPRGEELGKLTLAGSVRYNGRQVQGTLTWKDTSIRFDEVGEYPVEWIFTPEEPMYAAVEGVIDITVIPSTYVCGVELNRNGKHVVKIWKNGNVLYTLTDGQYDAGVGNMIFSNGHLYTCGYQINERRIENAKIWKDNELLYWLTDGTKPTYAYTVQIVDGLLYTSGKEYYHGNYVAKVWKNNIVLHTTDENINTEPFGMAISNNHIYQCVG